MAAPPAPGSSPLSLTVLDLHGAQPHDVVGAEYFAGLGFQSRWCKLAVNSHNRRFRVAQFVEINDTARTVLNRAVPGSQIIGNIAEVGKLNPCRLAFAGFPCKGTSTRGKVRGATDAIDNDHTSMVHQLLRALANTDSKPQVVLLENVQGLLSARHEGKRGGFFRWLIRNLKSLGYAGEWRLYASGVEAMSGDRVFILCRQEGVTSVRGSLLSLGEEDRGAKPENGYGFSRVKVGDAPVRGRLACLTESTGKPCFVFCDDGEYKCVEFTLDAVADLFTFTRQDIVVGSGEAADAKALKMLANACRPVGQAVINKLVDNLLEATPVEALPDGAMEVQHQENCSLPNMGYWLAHGDEIFAYKGTSRAIIRNGERSERTAAAFAADCLRTGHAITLKQTDIIEYIEKAAVHEARRRQASLSHHLAALCLAAFPGCSILKSHKPVAIRAAGHLGLVFFLRRFDRGETREMPHMFWLPRLGNFQPAFVCFHQWKKQKGTAFGVLDHGIDFDVLEGQLDERMVMATDDLRAFIDLDGTPSTPSDDIDDSDSDCSWEVPESIEVDEQMCEGCGGGGETRPGMTDAETLLCDGDGCERAWHIACLRPPLTTVLEGDWMCPICVEEAPGEARGGGEDVANEIF